MDKSIVLLSIALALFFVHGCQRKIDKSHTDVLIPIYNGKEVHLVHQGYWTTVPVIDSYLKVNKRMSLERRLQKVLSSVSKSYFNNLDIQLIKIDSVGGVCIGHINLHEHKNYAGPGSLNAWNSWYDYFQGSTGGIQTSIILKENSLQRCYKHEWIDGVSFYYQGEPMDEWDHIDLEGMFFRYGDDGAG